MSEEVIYGFRAVLEALSSGRREVFEVLDATGSKEVARAAAERSVRVGKLDRRRADELTRGGVHQGVLARVEEYPYVGLDDLLGVDTPLLLVLDGVTDPHNLGAVLRVAEGAGVTGVVIPKDRSASVNAVVVKASSGASEHLPVARETNLRRALDRMKEVGVWVFAAESGAGTNHTKLDMAGPVALVLGSEGKGVRRLVREGCDGAVEIPMSGAVGSLNVSVAAAVLAFEARRQRGWNLT